MASPYTPQCQDVSNSSTITYGQIMGSIYMVNNGSSNITFHFDAGAGGSYTMVPGDAVNLEDIVFQSVTFVFASPGALPVTAVPRGS